MSSAMKFKWSDFVHGWTVKKFFYSFAWLAGLLIALDQVSKWTVVNAFSGVIGSQQTLIPNFLVIHLTINSGMSYGFLGGSSWIGWRIILAVISWVASAAFVYYWMLLQSKNEDDKWMNAIIALLFAGALGNGIDRAFYWESTVGFSGVIDFIEIYFFGPNVNPPFGVFNIADAALSIGIVMLVIVYIVRAIKSYKKGE